MIPVIDSIKYGWEKTKENMQISLFATLLLLAVGSMTGGKGDHNFLLGILSAVFLIIIRIGYTKIFLKIEDGAKPKFSEIFEEYPLFWKYLGVSILVPIVIVLGLIVFIIPGVILAVRTSLAPIILVDTKVGPVDSMKKSWAISKGFFWKLLGFWLAIAGVNILGFLCLGVGLLFTIPLSTIASIQVYKALNKTIVGPI